MQIMVTSKPFVGVSIGQKKPVKRNRTSQAETNNFICIISQSKDMITVSPLREFTITPPFFSGSLLTSNVSYIIIIIIIIFFL